MTVSGATCQATPNPTRIRPSLGSELPRAGHACPLALANPSQARAAGPYCYCFSAVAVAPVAVAGSVAVAVAVAVGVAVAAAAAAAVLIVCCNTWFVGTVVCLMVTVFGASARYLRLFPSTSLLCLSHANLFCPRQ